jgi:hypothetical protein
MVEYLIVVNIIAQLVCFSQGSYPGVLYPDFTEK